jgi:HEPN domain-containing protein
VKRADFQTLADVRIAEAKVLLDLGNWPGAFYLAGYAVECGLKACIAKLTQADDFPDKGFAEKCYTHDIERLVTLAGLKAEKDADTKASAAKFANWTTVSDWTEASRYEVKTERDARTLYAAITDPADGVLPWIKLHW